MKLFSKVLESWKDEKAFEKRLAAGLAAMEINGYIKEKNNRRLKKIIRCGRFSDILMPELILSENGRILRYYVYSGRLTSYGKACLAHVARCKLVQWGLSDWLGNELMTYALSQDSYEALMSSGNEDLIAAYEELRHYADELNCYLMPYQDRLFPISNVNWDDFSHTLSSGMCYPVCDSSEAKEAVENMVWPEELQLALAAVGNVSLIDAWLGIGLLRNRAIERLDKAGIAFEVKPYLCRAAEEEIKKQGLSNLLDKR